MKTPTQYTSTAVFVSHRESDGAEYVCTANVSPIPPHVTSGERKSGTGTFRIGKTHDSCQINFGVMMILIIKSWNSFPAN